jgi:ribosome-associated protein
MTERPHGLDEASESDGVPEGLAMRCAQALADDKCEDVVVLDLRGRSPVTDFFVIGTGTSQRQMRSAGLHVEEMLQGEGQTVFRSNLKERESSWYILDCSEIVVHLFEPETRLYYDLEMLWGDAERIPWERPDQAERARERGDDRNRAGLRADDILG